MTIIFSYDILKQVIEKCKFNMKLNKFVVWNISGSCHIDCFTDPFTNIMPLVRQYSYPTRVFHMALNYNAVICKIK